jgi:hypothetical protein
MRGQSISLILVYEPNESLQGPIPIARISDPVLSLAAARSAIAAAEARAADFSRMDGLLAEVEMAEARRLREVLSLLIPDLASAGDTSVSKLAGTVM